VHIRKNFDVAHDINPSRDSMERFCGPALKISVGHDVKSDLSRRALSVKVASDRICHLILKVA